jgi:hypothetical protein
VPVLIVRRCGMFLGTAVMFLSAFWTSCPSARTGGRTGSGPASLRAAWSAWRREGARPALRSAVIRGWLPPLTRTTRIDWLGSRRGAPRVPPLVWPSGCQGRRRPSRSTPRPGSGPGTRSAGSSSSAWPRGGRPRRRRTPWPSSAPVGQAAEFASAEWAPTVAASANSEGRRAEFASVEWRPTIAACSNSGGEGAGAGVHEMALRGRPRARECFEQG